MFVMVHDNVPVGNGARLVRLSARVARHSCRGLMPKVKISKTPRYRI